MTPTETWVRRSEHGAQSIPGTRTGQWLFNNLPQGAQTVIAGTLIDPFHKNLSHTELFDWINNHLIFDGSRVIGVFNHNQIIWEDSDETEVSTTPRSHGIHARSLHTQAS